MPSTLSREYDASSLLPGSVFLITSDGRTLRLPIPSPYSNDPLNWTPWKRICALAAVFFFTIIGLVQVQGVSLLFIALEEEYTPKETRPFRLNILASSTSLFQGIGAFVWIPLSLAIGRRPVFLSCTIILIVATGWAGMSGSFYQHLGARCLQGFAVGVCSSTVLLMIIDLTFTHQRPQAIASFWSVCAAVSNAILSIVPAVLTALGGWHAFYWGFVPFTIIAMLLAFIFCPETYFHRPAIAFDGHVLAQSATEGVKVYEGWNEVPGGKPIPERPETALEAVMKVLRVWGTGGKGGWTAMRACYPNILLCALNPMIFWVLLLNSLVLGGVVSISTTYVDLLRGDPYYFTIRSIALIRLSATAGALLAWPASGVITARIALRLTARNRGVRDVEHYLPSFILPILAGSASLVLYGLAGQNHWHWVWIFVAHGLNYFSFIALFTSNTLWAIEAFPRWAAAALTVIVGAANIASFGLSFGIAPWIERQGFAAPHCDIGALILAVGCVAVPVAFWGKRWREYIHSRFGMSEGGALRPRT